MAATDAFEDVWEGQTREFLKRTEHEIEQIQVEAHKNKRR